MKHLHLKHVIYIAYKVISFHLKIRQIMTMFGKDSTKYLLNYTCKATFENNPKQNEKQKTTAVNSAFLIPENMEN